MVKVLFVCWGNICRSPMGEYIFKDMVEKRGLEDKIYVESAATSTEELGNPVYPPARDELIAAVGPPDCPTITLRFFFCTIYFFI